MNTESDPSRASNARLRNFRGPGSLRGRDGDRARRELQRGVPVAQSGAWRSRAERSLDAMGLRVDGDEALLVRLDGRCTDLHLEPLPGGSRVRIRDAPGLCYWEGDPGSPRFCAVIQLLLAMRPY